MIIYSEQNGGVLTEEERGVLDLYIRLFETDTSPLIFRWLSTKSKRRLAELKNDGDKTLSESKFKQNILKDLIIKSKATIDSLKSNPNILNTSKKSNPELKNIIEIIIYGII